MSSQEFETQVSLFGPQKKDPPFNRRTGPLAYRMRPHCLEEFRGQSHLFSEDKPLKAWIESDRLPSLVFWGPPGCGKTSLAQIIAHQTSAQFITLSAVHSGVKEIKEATQRAELKASTDGVKTILFVDEIHRFNKAQQDALLPHVENGTLILIGATTENPSFEINSALLSRMRVVRLEALTEEAILEILTQALNEPQRGLGGLIKIDPEALEWIAQSSLGDARKAVTTLENLALAFRGRDRSITLKEVKKNLERQPIRYDKNGEEHYDVISAFIKSIRDSDPHAGLYYLARMLEGGEDPLFIARRLVILASEDIGNADPRAVQLAVSIKEAVHFVGMPEARISLAQAVTYLALAPKSNASYLGIEKAIEEVRRSGPEPVPYHLRNSVTGLMKKMGYGKNYRYAHNEKEQRSGQTHLPKKIIGKKFYFPKKVGLENQMKEKLDRLNKDFE